jgi:hypothetical protein
MHAMIMLAPTGLASARVQSACRDLNKIIVNSGARECTASARVITVFNLNRGIISMLIAPLGDWLAALSKSVSTLNGSIRELAQDAYTL